MISESLKQYKQQQLRYTMKLTSWPTLIDIPLDSSLLEEDPIFIFTGELFS